MLLSDYAIIFKKTVKIFYIIMNIFVLLYAHLFGCPNHIHDTFITCFNVYDDIMYTHLHECMTWMSIHYFLSRVHCTPKKPLCHLLFQSGHHLLLPQTRHASLCWLPLHQLYLHTSLPFPTGTNSPIPPYTHCSPTPAFLLLTTFHKTFTLLNTAHHLQQDIHGEKFTLLNIVHHLPQDMNGETFTLHNIAHHLPQDMNG